MAAKKPTKVAVKGLAWCLAHESMTYFGPDGSTAIVVTCPFNGQPHNDNPQPSNQPCNSRWVKATVSYESAKAFV